MGWAGGCEYPKLEEERLEADATERADDQSNEKRASGMDADVTSERIRGSISEHLDGLLLHAVGNYVFHSGVSQVSLIPSLLD